ncbi:uncharacterized protein [Miscanthus floridulus]|uniref:uncharacterized protein n=1 Tax=Miscanthus floridulus TaxID=154761 RepID=UPI003458960C
MDMDHNCFNLAVWMAASNNASMLEKDKYHYMDLQFASRTQFGRDPRCCDWIDYEELAKLLQCGPDRDYKIQNCSTILLPYFRDRNYILFIFDMGNKIVHILDPHSPKLWYSGLDPIMPYNGILEIVLNYFSFSMTLVNPAWKENVYLWHRQLKLYLPKAMDWKLAGFLVYNYLKLWNGERLSSFVNIRSDSLRTEFLVHILKSSANECTYDIPGELQDLLKLIN